MIERTTRHRDASEYVAEIVAGSKDILKKLEGDANKLRPHMEQCDSSLRVETKAWAAKTAAQAADAMTALNNGAAK